MRVHGEGQVRCVDLVYQVNGKADDWTRWKLFHQPTRKICHNDPLKLSPAQKKPLQTTLGGQGATRNLPYSTRKWPKFQPRFS